MGSAPRYNPKRLNEALQLLLQAAEASPALKQQPNLRVDVVDLAQSMMGNAFIVHLDALNSSILASPPSTSAIDAAGQALTAAGER
jgi:hypothetical protein